MISRQTILFIVSLAISLNLLGQKVSNDKYLILQNHPTKDGKFIARFLDKQTLRTIEHWEMESLVADVNVENFNKLIKDRLIFPDGDCYTFYPKMKLKTQCSYERGEKIGEEKGFFEDRKLKYKANFNKTQDGITEHYYRNGTVKKVEEFSSGWRNGEVVEYYSNGSKKSISNFVNGKLMGRYESFHPNGETKRKAKFQENNETSAKCFDENGEFISNTAFFVSPAYPDGFDAFVQEMEKLDFSSNQANTDTACFKLTLAIDSLGNVNSVNYNFSHTDSLLFMLQNWSKTLKQFTPAYVDDCSHPSYLNISLAVSGTGLVWLGEPFTGCTFYKPYSEIENRPTWFWEFPVPSNDDVYMIVDNLPQFPGGEQNLRKYIASQLQYPMEAQQKGIQGKVYVSFIVEKDGSVTNTKIARSVHPLLDNEAMRIIKRLPDWQAGTHFNRPVRVSFTVPINFAFR